MKDRDVPAIVSALPGDWATWQPPGRKGESAIVWDAGKFSAPERGSELGMRGKGFVRWMTWAMLESDQGTLPVVALHMPTRASQDPLMRRYFQTMTRNYQRFFSEMNGAGYPPVVGGDWNHPLHKTREPWSPVPMLRQVGLTTNWLQGTPCSGTSANEGRIDGFAYNPRYLQAIDQGCLDRRSSDHRPVWVALAPN